MQSSDKSFFFFVYDELIRRKMFERNPHSYGEYVFVRADLGRLSYKTSYIVEKASDEDIIIVDSHARVVDMKLSLRQHGKPNIPVVSAKEQNFFRGKRQSFNIMWIDECNRRVLDDFFPLIHSNLVSLVVIMGDFK